MMELIKNICFVLIGVVAGIGITNSITPRATFISIFILSSLTVVIKMIEELSEF